MDIENLFNILFN